MTHLACSQIEVVFGDRVVLRGACLDIPPGGRTALLGANGSGKTTLLRTLSGALAPRRGTVRVDDVAVRFDRAGLRAHRQRVQLVTQNPDDQLFAPDVFRDVSFGPLNLGLTEREVRRRVAESLGLLTIEDLAERPTHELSFGQRKKVALAGALAMRPGVLLLDEPTAGLDPHGVEEMTRAMERLLEERTTVVLCTHDVDFALGWADTVAVLVDGRVRHGTPAGILSDAALLSGARLRRPLVLEAAARLALNPAAITDVGSLVAAIRPEGGAI